MYNDLPERGDHLIEPSYKVSVSPAVVRVFNGVKHPVFNYGNFQYEDFQNGDAQANYQKYLASEVKANAADDARARYLEAHIGRLNGLVREFVVLQNRINSLISSAESAQGVFSYGQTTIDDLKKIIVEIKELKKAVQSGEKYIWQWRSGGGSIDSTLGTLKEMESGKKAHQASMVQLKKDYATALKTYGEEVKERKLERQKQAEEEKKVAAEKKAQALEKKKAEEKAAKQELARLEAEKQASIKKTKAREEQRTKAFNTPLKKSKKSSNKNKVAPTTGTTKTSKTQTKSSPPSAQPSAPKKTTAPSAQPSAQKKSTLPFGFSGIPSET